MCQRYCGQSNDGNNGENIKFSYFYQCIQQFINTNIIASIKTLDEAQENSPSILQHFVALIKIYDDKNIKSDDDIQTKINASQILENRNKSDINKKIDDIQEKNRKHFSVPNNNRSIRYSNFAAIRLAGNIVFQIKKISAYKKLQKICDKLSVNSNDLVLLVIKKLFDFIKTQLHNNMRTTLLETWFESTIRIFQNIILPLIKAQHLLIFQIFNAFFITLSQVCLTLRQFAKIKYSNMKLFEQIVGQNESVVTRGWSERSSVLYSNILPTDAKIRKSKEIFQKEVDKYSDKWDIQQGFTVNHSKQTQKRYDMLQSGMLIPYIQQSPYNVNWLVNELNTNEKYKQYFKESKITVNDVYNIIYTDNQKQYIKSISSILHINNSSLTITIPVYIAYRKHHDRSCRNWYRFMVESFT